MIIYCIYKSTNKITSKSYIGYTAAGLSKRKSSHIRKSFYRNSNAYHNIFHRAIRKYGKDAFEWEILYQSTDKEHTIKEMESHFIKEYNTFKPYGYNMTLGGEGSVGRVGFKHSKETIEKLRMVNTGVVFSIERKRNISLSKIGKKRKQIGNKIHYM